MNGKTGSNRSDDEVVSDEEKTEILKMVSKINSGLIVDI
jgi:hypothetical protein